MSRRTFLQTTLAAAGVLAAPAIGRSAGGQVVVVGGGFAGATCARTLKQAFPAVTVTLVVEAPFFTAAPFSNAVLAGLRGIRAQQYTYDRLAAEGIVLAISPAQGIETGPRIVTLGNGATISYDRLVLAPGTAPRFGAVQGYGEAAASRMPHACSGGEQTLLLRQQLEAMADGGVVAISVPSSPALYPWGPYERASLIAHYLRAAKPRSKVLILDGNDQFAGQALFQEAWKQFYPGRIEWIGANQGGRVSAVDPATMTLITDVERHHVAVANVIPPPQAGGIAERAGITDRGGFCATDPASFESKSAANIHVIGDAAAAGEMTKSAFAAGAQAKACAHAIGDLMEGFAPKPPLLVDAHYALIAPDYAISDTRVYRPLGGRLVRFRGAGGSSRQGAARTTRALEAVYAEGVFRTLTGEAFG